jgi:hypothetical protein
VLLSQRSRWSLAATRNRLLRPPLRLLMPRHLPQRLLPTLLLRPHLLPTPPLRLPTLLLRLLRRPTRRTDPHGSGMKARVGRDPVCAGFRVFVA